MRMNLIEKFIYCVKVQCLKQLKTMPYQISFWANNRVNKYVKNNHHFKMFIYSFYTYC